MSQETITRRIRVSPRQGVSVVALAVLVTASACGASGGGPVDSGTSPTRPATTVVDPTATTVAGSTAAGATTEVVVYFTKGEKITAVTRAVPKVARIGAEAMKALVGGPTDGERALGLGTAVPAATRFGDLAISDGVAKVDLSKDFESGGGSLSLSLRLAQVTCTLDRFDTIGGVLFLLDGQLVDVFSGDGIVLDHPVSCADYDQYVDDGAPVAATFPGIWPFTTRSEMDAYLSGSDRTFTTPTATALQFGSKYLGMPDPEAFGPPKVATGGLVEVDLGFRTGEGGIVLPDPQPTTSVFLMSGHADGDLGPWTVVSASSPQIVVTQPAALDRVSAAAAVKGSAATFEGNVEVQVREDGMLAGSYLGRGPVTGRGDGVLGPFAGDITFRPPTKPAGAIVFAERSSLETAGVVRATVVRVTF